MEIVKDQKSSMNVMIRAMKESEYPSLNEFLYEAIYVPEGVEAPSKTIVNSPELQVYIDQFGKGRADHAIVAEVDGNIVGAVWVRLMKDYGYLDKDTPSLAISLCKQYRSRGIGTALMKAMLSHLKTQGYQQVSLAVQKENYALNMYVNVGFKVVKQTQDEYIMIKYM